MHVVLLAYRGFVTVDFFGILDSLVWNSLIRTKENILVEMANRWILLDGISLEVREQARHWRATPRRNVPTRYGVWVSLGIGVPQSDMDGHYPPARRVS